MRFLITFVRNIMSSNYFEETSFNPLRLEITTDGQGTRTLEKDLIANANRPPAFGFCDTCHLSNFVGTDLFCWYGRKSNGYFYPHGKVLRITEAGIQYLLESTNMVESFSKPYIEKLYDRLINKSVLNQNNIDSLYKLLAAKND